VSEGAVTALGGDGPLADCRYTVVIPGRYSKLGDRQEPVADLAEARRLLEQSPHGWVVDRTTEERLKLEDLPPRVEAS
jgi:hypothetical protein